MKPNNMTPTNKYSRRKFVQKAGVSSLSLAVGSSYLLSACGTKEKSAEVVAEAVAEEVVAKEAPAEAKKPKAKAAPKKKVAKKKVAKKKATKKKAAKKADDK